MHIRKPAFSDARVLSDYMVEPETIVAVDLDGDGARDIICASGKGASVVLVPESRWHPAIIQTTDRG